ncbi:peptidoglycan DD-metalloendopeptidase family protein [Bacillus cihuensis]|uniref:peptidoglycan DD-metalloendopeptidase family protein n=1 Tax=Bacillus cihuensis TaxID=1208599 RepID=UPI0004263E72|nr:peptidoglycan DD-metalloendopeptidase family protein [Bacillus cihuensis]
MAQNNEEQESLIKQIAKDKAKKVIKQKAKALMKKAVKAAAKVAAKALLAAGKALLGFLGSIGLPYILGIVGGLLLLFMIYLATTMIFTGVGGANESLTGEAKELQEYVTVLVDNSVDSSKPEQLPYKVPLGLVISALQIYESYERDESPKEAAEVMVNALKPVFQYVTLDQAIETETTTCTTTDGQTSCSTSTNLQKSQVSKLEHVESWNQQVEFIYTPLITDWKVSSSTSTSTTTKDVVDAEGNITKESVTVETVTTTKTREHTQSEEEIVTEDYSYYVRVLSGDPFDYGDQDLLMVEALFAATGGEIRYSEWLEGGSMIGFSGTVTPGAGVPTAFMQHYLNAQQKYKVDWYYLAAFHYIETGFSTHPTMLSSAGAEGHTQFMPCTWLGWSYPSCKGSNGGPNIPDTIKYNPAQIKKYGGYGRDGNGNGIASPWEIEDAVFTTAYYLSKSGFSNNVDKAIYAYNHADWYVTKIKNAAEQFKNEALYTPDSGSVPPLAPGTFMRPTAGTVTSPYGYRKLGSKMHYGIDFGKTSDKTPIVAAADGVVTRSITGCPAKGYYGSSCGGGFGNHVYVKHTVGGQTYEAVYAHFKSVSVQQGQTVTQGQLLGIMGTSGSSTGIHLHFELHKGSKQQKKNVINPALLIPL